MFEPQELMVIRDHSHMIRGKRTKRQRPISQLSLTMATSSCSTAEVTGGGFGGAATKEEEEEDMANCLILLAKGKTEKSCEQTAVMRSNVYQCKTCNRCFPSFQALGGHRASHKKPKKKTLEEHVLQISDDHGTDQISRCSTDLCSQENNKFKVHECSICGTEFNSGQALGGHMRRHRTVPNHDQVESLKATKSRNLLALDLNLPAAPEDDDDDYREYSSFSFASKEQILVFSASPLVDFHN
ncbi:unnamed protein product [Fraxinus pennsylvanica]|uniref:C2H2-type domain-containing protein n=1 Tax=Fraxinus pennsylvanica TaxID=56036 RepID=A0AAD2A0C9_9LAMI|nr:unnamed protein product [Fraxinus pennsylvanica]